MPTEYPYPTTVPHPYVLPDQPGATTGNIALLMQMRHRANHEGPDVIADYGAIASDPADNSQAAWNTTRVQMALDENQTVVLGGGNVVVDEVVVGRDFARLQVLSSGGLHGSGEATHLVTLEGDYAEIGGVLIPKSGNLSAVHTTGFRNFLDDATLTGVSINALHVDSLETQCFMGRYRGGTTSGIRYYSADGGVADLQAYGTYLQHNGAGLDANGAGSIDFVGVHSESNTGQGFKLQSTSSSRFSHCFADSNGGDGWSLADINYGMDLVMCHSFRSSSLVDGRYDWSFFDVFNTNLFACDSQSDSRNGHAKGGSFRFIGDNDIDFWGCKVGDIARDGSGDPIVPGATAGLIGATMSTRFHQGAGLVLPFNVGELAAKSVSGTNIGSLSTVADLSFPIKSGHFTTANSARSFWVTATWRRNSNGGYGSDTFLVTPQTGLTGGTPVKPFGTAEGVDLSNPTLDVREANGFPIGVTLTFDCENLLDSSIQVGFYVEERVSPRGLAN